MKRAESFCRLVLSIVFLCAMGCSKNSSSLDVPQPQLNNTAKGALIGTGVGGGLGLIIGSTSGNAGEGLLIGSAAGAVVGAGIGSQINSGEKVAEKEPLLHEEEEIQEHRRELKEIRKESRDVSKKEPNKNQGKKGQIEWLSKPSRARPASAYNTQVARRETPSTESRGRLSDTPRAGGEIAASEGPISFADVKKAPPAKVKTNPAIAPEKMASTGGLPPAASIPPDAGAADVVPTLAAKNAPAKALAPKDAANCTEAQKEAQRGLRASSDADRLFYLRRAARLCPTQADYHAELGKLYSSIGKTEDAKFEFRQAIDLEPNHQIARDELSIIENASNIVQ